MLYQYCKPQRLKERKIKMPTTETSKGWEGTGNIEHASGPGKRTGVGKLYAQNSIMNYLLYTVIP